MQGLGGVSGGAAAEGGLDKKQVWNQTGDERSTEILNRASRVAPRAAAAEPGTPQESETTLSSSSGKELSASEWSPSSISSDDHRQLEAEAEATLAEREADISHRLPQVPHICLDSLTSQSVGSAGSCANPDAAAVPRVEEERGARQIFEVDRERQAMREAKFELMEALQEMIELTKRLQEKRNKLRAAMLRQQLAEQAAGLDSATDTAAVAAGAQACPASSDKTVGRAMAAQTQLLDVLVKEANDVEELLDSMLRGTTPKPKGTTEQAPAASTASSSRAGTAQASSAAGDAPKVEIVPGTMIQAMKETGVFQYGPNRGHEGGSWPEIGVLKRNQVVRTTDVPSWRAGYYMVSIDRPRGLVDLNSMKRVPVHVAAALPRDCGSIGSSRTGAKVGTDTGTVADGAACSTSPLTQAPAATSIDAARCSSNAGGSGGGSATTGTGGTACWGPPPPKATDAARCSSNEGGIGGGSATTGTGGPAGGGPLPLKATAATPMDSVCSSNGGGRGGRGPSIGTGSTACGGPPAMKAPCQPPLRAPRGKPLRLQGLLLGDSITQEAYCAEQGSAKATKAAGWVALLEEHCSRRVDILNRGYSGYNTRQALAVLQHILQDPVIQKQLLFVVMMFGANDAASARYIPKQHVPVHEFKENLTEIVREVWKQGCRHIVLLSPTPVDRADLWPDRCNQTVLRYARAVEEVANRIEHRDYVHYVELYESMMSRRNWTTFLSDGLHLSPSGQKWVFDRLAAALPKLPPEDLPPFEELPGDSMNEVRTRAQFLRKLPALYDTEQAVEDDPGYCWRDACECGNCKRARDIEQLYERICRAAHGELERLSKVLQEVENKDPAWYRVVADSI